MSVSGYTHLIVSKLCFTSVKPKLRLVWYTLNPILLKRLGPGKDSMQKLQDLFLELVSCTPVPTALQKLQQTLKVFGNLGHIECVITVSQIHLCNNAECVSALMQNQHVV